MSHPEVIRPFQIKFTDEPILTFVCYHGSAVSEEREPLIPVGAPLAFFIHNISSSNIQDNEHGLRARK
jgi:hypothetical protein